MSINRTILREQVKELLLERILGGVYSPGDRLVETQLAQELGTSLAPVRESLRELEALGFVQSSPFRGSRVRAVSKAELLEGYPVRAALEEVAARAAAPRLNGQVQALQAELDSMRRAADTGDLHSQVRHDVAFHRLIVEAAGNGVLLKLWSSLWIEARTLISAIETHLEPHQVVEMHQPVLDALASQDSDRAGTLLRAHVEFFGTLIIKGGAE
jgi:DNA-binding GntR family transcriptional regulator